MAYDPVIQPDHTFDAQWFSPVFMDVCGTWKADLSGGWGIDYDVEGLAGLNQTWVVPRHEKLPLVLRQMLSWNRDLYKQYFQIRDWNPVASPRYFDRPLVPVSARLTPLPTNNSPAFLANQFQTDVSGKIASGGDDRFQCRYNVFPSVYTDKYRLDVQWARDEFTNRFGIKYAKVEIEPSIRLESISGSAMGLVKINPEDGTPKIPEDGRAIEKLTTGFPSREPQVLIKVTFPWVSLQNAGAIAIVKNGPIGNWLGNVNGPGAIPNGLLLGCINNDTFLGYPRGHVLYQSASLVEKVSPVTGRLGYQVTHDFLCLGTSEWNMARLQGEVKSTDVEINSTAGQETALWPYGFIVATDKQGVVTITANPPLNSPVFPYPYAALSRLFYYGGTNDSPPNDEA